MAIAAASNAYLISGLSPKNQVIVIADTGRLPIEGHLHSKLDNIAAIGRYGIGSERPTM